MNSWLERKVTYEKMNEAGMQKKVTESYMIDALSFTEAEARIVENVKPFIQGEFLVTSVAKKKIYEVFQNENGESIFKIKVGFITLDDKSGCEKMTKADMLVWANDLEESIQVLKEGMKNSLSDYQIVAVTKTSIIDVFFYDSNTPETPGN